MSARDVYSCTQLYSNLITTLGCGSYQLYFTDEETEAHRGRVTLPRIPISGRAMGWLKSLL